MADTTPRARKRNVETAYPLSPMQQGMLFHSLYAPGSGVYFEQLSCELRGALDLAAFQRAWQQVLDRHPILRSAFAWRRQEKPLQVVYKEVSLPIEALDWRAVPVHEQKQRLTAYLSADRAKGFDLSRAPLMRLSLLRTGEIEHRLVWSYHHILLDGWSMPVLLKEVFALYEAYVRGGHVALPLPPPYRDYISWLETQDAEVAEAYWRNAMAGFAAPTSLGAMKRDASRHTARAGGTFAQTNGFANLDGTGTVEVEVRLSADETAALGSWARQNGITLSTVLQGAWGILLSRYACERDIVFGATVSGRPATLPGSEAMIGLFINTLPVRVQVVGEAEVGAWLRKLQAQLAEMRQYEYTPLVQVQGWSDAPRDKPLFDTIIVFENYPVDATLLEQLGSLQIRDVRSYEQTNYPITLVSGPSRELGLKISYDRSRFDDSAVRRMLGHLTTLLQGMATSPNLLVNDLPMLGATERQQILAAWSASEQELPDDTRCLHEIFEVRAALTPDAIALVAAGDPSPAQRTTLTYDALNRRANQLARRLRSLGGGAETIIGLLTERSLEMVIAVLAILKAGAAYLPLDPDYPAERLRFMLQDSGAKILLTQVSLAHHLPLTPDHVLCIDDAKSDDDARCAEMRLNSSNESEANLGRIVTSANLANVIYTSGSTGLPKGVMVEHQSVVNHARALIDATGLGRGDRLLQFVSLSFDAAGEEFYPALLSGATLVMPGNTQALIGPELPIFCDQYDVTVLHMPAAVWHTIIDDLLAHNATCSAPLRLLMLGGDAPDVTRLHAFTKILGREIPFINLYGPTEATITTTLYRTTTAPKLTRVPIGRPIANARVYILDESGQPAPVGVPGEICIGGAGVARGYLNRTELTAERFVPADSCKLRPAPRSDAAEEMPPERSSALSRHPSRLYRTGDLARWLPDGDLEFLGRADNQVKIRGFRVEPGEVEAALKRESGVRDALVLPREASGSGKRLVAYVVGNGDISPNPTELRSGLRKHLPEYMIPTSFVMLTALPLTATGKVDRRALPAPEDWNPSPEEKAISVDSGFAVPRTPDEELLTGIFHHILGVSRVNRNDNFFDLGGHSLLATRLASRIREVFGVELALRDLFEAPTVAGMASLIASARQNQTAKPSLPITHVPRPGETADAAPLPLSYAQQRLWFLDQLEPGNLFYNIPTVMRLRGKLRVAALTAALGEIVRRHEVLRTTFATNGGVPYQIIAPKLELSLPITDLSVQPAAQREAEALRLAREEIRRPFNLAAGPLLRGRLLKLADNEHIAVLTIHHSVTDGWSMGVFAAELAKLYEMYWHLEGCDISPLPDLPFQYADYATWQRQWLEGEVKDGSTNTTPLQRQMDYWKQQLANGPARLDLPTDRPRPAVQSSNGSTYTFHFSKGLSNNLIQLGRAQGVTMFMTLLAGYQTLLARYSGQRDIVVGSALANRTHAELEPLIGFFVNTLVFRTQFEGNLTFKDLLARVRETALAAYAHQDVPFEMLVDAVQPERNLSHSPLFQAAFSLQNVPAPVRELPGLTLEPVDLDTGISGYDMLLQAAETVDGIACVWEYNSDLFDASTIVRMAGHLQVLLSAAVADPKHPVETLPLLTEREQQMMLVEWNNTEAAFPSDLTIHGLFEEQVRRIPDMPAVAFAAPGLATLSLSYSELDRHANQVAHALLELGVKPNVLVGISADRSVDMIVGILGILKSGAAYLPLDPHYPSERIAFMLADARIDVLLTQTHLVDRLPLHMEKHTVTHVVRLDADWEHGDADSDENEAPQTGVGADDLAYCIYTSGSTGRPKGALLRHRGLCNLAEVQKHEFDLREGKRVLQFSPLSFDASAWEMVMALGSGATLILTRQDILASGQDLLRLLQEQRITTVTLPPSLLSVLSPTALPDLETVIAAGERCTNEIVQAWAPGRRFFNAYGPTETTVCASLHACDPSRTWPFGGPPIGKPISNFQLYVVDESLQPQPIGVPGELLVGGVGLAKGYLNRPELTAERFVPIENHRLTAVTRGNRQSPSLYSTGDLVRWLPDGNLEFLGRIDDQVKVRGFRIELGEIESVLREHPAVKGAVVTARGDSLIGYVVPEMTKNTPGIIADLRHHLRQRLPEYMIPAAFVTLDAFPRSPAGKIDRKSLPLPDGAERNVASVFVAPRDEMEEELCLMAAELLNLEHVGVEDNFFELGGHSLLATQLIARIRAAYHIELPLRTLFEHPTVAGLVEELNRVRDAQKLQTEEAARIVATAKSIQNLSPEEVRALLAQKKSRVGRQVTESGGEP